MRKYLLRNKSAQLASVASTLLLASMVPTQAQAAGEAENADADAANDTIVVTANRRTQDVTKIPYNIAVVGGEQLASTGVTNIEDLSRQIPNLVVTSAGNQNVGAQRQIMRGLSASPGDRQGQALEQNSVSTYLDNSPYANFFPVKDIERVEVLRGPQGTLYGAGSLGGAIRLIAAEPKLGVFEGSLAASVGLVHKSKDHDYSVDGVINIPLGDTLAARLSASHDRNAGFIDAVGLFVTSRGDPLGLPQLANPSNPVTSSALRESKKDINWDKSTFWRAALKWEPSENFEALVAYNRVKSRGFGSSADMPDFNGGVDPLDPAITYPDTGEYEIVRRVREPFNRTSEMWTADLSYDMGFATLSTTTSFFKTHGEVYAETTLGTVALPAVFVPYYTGTPTNPRFNSVAEFADRSKSFTQEVRLVSKENDTIDFVVGAFYQREKRTDLWSSFGLGQYAYNQTPGVVSFSGIGPDDRFFTVGGSQKFTDKSVFGELTWHASERLDVSAGVRYFEQTLSRDAESNIPNFFLFEQASNKTKYSDQIFKFNVSYEFADRHQIYAIFSQGFRRGGANAFALSGFALEPAQLLNYEPDKVDNYEVGLKGRFDNDWVYTFDLFYDEWSKPQIGTFTPYNVWPVTVNGEKARSKGAEFELRGPIGQGFDFALGYSYTDAQLTKDFCLPAGVGDGVNIDPCALRGLAGTVLPSAPKHSGTFTLNYVHELANGDAIKASFNANYKSSMRQNLPARNSRYPLLPGYWLTNFNLSWETDDWMLSGYVRNIFNERPVYGVYSRITPFTPLDLVETVGRPREMGLSLRFSW